MLSNNDNERRAMLALLLSITVYFVWMNFFAPPSVAVPERTEKLGAPQFTGEIHSSDGALRAVHLSDYTTSATVTPLYSWALGKLSGAEGGWEPYSGGGEPYEMLSDAGALVLAGAGEIAPSEGYLIERGDGTITATHSEPGGLTIIKEYRPTDQPYMMDVRVTFINNGAAPVSDLWVGVADEMSGSAGRFQNARRPLAHIDGDIEHFDDLDDLREEAEGAEGAPSWYGVGDRYFMSVLLPGEGSGISELVVDEIGEDRFGAFAVSNVPADAGGGKRTLEFRAYVGPKKLDVLETISADMADAVELGWFGFFARILLWLLKIFQGTVINWGVSILLLTLLVKLAFFPLTQRSFKSSQKMQEIQPQLQAIREKYADNQQLQSQETMKLFQENGVNPLGGCLPMLIQLPVFIALYNVMLYSVELYGSQFTYLKELTAEDPYGVLPVVYALLILGQQQMMPMGNMDPALPASLYACVMTWRAPEDFYRRVPVQPAALLSFVIYAGAVSAGWLIAYAG